MRAISRLGRADSAFTVEPEGPAISEVCAIARFSEETGRDADDDTYMRSLIESAPDVNNKV